MQTNKCVLLFNNGNSLIYRYTPNTTTIVKTVLFFGGIMFEWFKVGKKTKVPMYKQVKE